MLFFTFFFDSLFKINPQVNAIHHLYHTQPRNDEVLFLGVNKPKITRDMFSEIIKLKTICPRSSNRFWSFWRCNKQIGSPWWAWGGFLSSSNNCSYLTALFWNSAIKTDETKYDIRCKVTLTRQEPNLVITDAHVVRVWKVTRSLTRSRTKGQWGKYMS